MTTVESAPETPASGTSPNPNPSTVLTASPATPTNSAASAQSPSSTTSVDSPTATATVLTQPASQATPVTAPSDFVASRPWSRRGSDQPLFNPVLAVWVAVTGFVASRAILLFMAASYSRSDGMSGLDAMMRWDALRYVEIAAEGYSTNPEDNQAAFFPGLPLLLRILNTIGLPYAWGGMLLSLVASIFVVWALYRLVNGGVAGAIAVVAWSFAPVAVFSVLPYTEAPFLALALWAWLRAREDRWAWAAGLAAGACLFRVSGLFLLGALVLLAILGERARWPQDWRAVGRRLVWLLIPLAVLVTWSAYGKLHFGSWMAWYEAQVNGWSRSFHWPWQAYQNTVSAIQNDAANAWVFGAETVTFWIGLTITIICFLRYRVAQGAWVGVHVLAFSTSYWLLSISRSTLLWFPLWTLIGEVAERRLKGLWWWARLVAVTVWLLFSGILMTVWAARYYRYGWAG